MTDDSTAAATVVTTRGRASAGLALMAVSLRSLGKSGVARAYFPTAWRFTPLAALKRSEDTLQERPGLG